MAGENRKGLDITPVLSVLEKAQASMQAAYDAGQMPPGLKAPHGKITLQHVVGYGAALANSLHRDTMGRGAVIPNILPVIATLQAAQQIELARHITAMATSIYRDLAEQALDNAGEEFDAPAFAKHCLEKAREVSDEFAEGASGVPMLIDDQRMLELINAGINMPVPDADVVPISAAPAAKAKADAPRELKPKTNRAKTA